MTTRTFKEFLKLSGPDRITTPMLSREERLTRYMPRAVVEMLERRQLLTLTVSLDAGTLEIDGTSGADNISVSINGSDTLIHIADGNGTPYSSYDPSNVSLIKILAGGGNDNVFINRSGVNKVQEVCLIYGEAGNDTVNGGVLADTVYGGDGNDSVNGFEGNDCVYGGVGYDTLDGGAGNDTLRGDEDNDSISGGTEEDYLYGGNGDDTLLAHDNGFSDVLDGGAGSDCASIDSADTNVINVEAFYP